MPETDTDHAADHLAQRIRDRDAAPADDRPDAEPLAREYVLWLRSTGMPRARIAERLGVRVNTIHRYAAQAARDNAIEHQAGDAA